MMKLTYAETRKRGRLLQFLHPELGRLEIIVISNGQPTGHVIYLPNLKRTRKAMAARRTAALARSHA